MYNFMEIDDKNTKFYMKRWRDVPPGTLGDKITYAIEMGIPIEYLVSKKIITTDNLSTFETDTETFDKILEYMVHLGLLASKNDIELPEQPKNVEETRPTPTEQPTTPEQKPTPTSIVNSDNSKQSEIQVKENKQLQDRNDELHNTISKLETEIKEVYEKLDIIETEKSDIERQKNSLEIENSNLTEQIKDHSKSIELLQEELTTTSQTEGDTQNLINKIKSERAKIAEELKESNDTINSLKDQFNTISKEKSELELLNKALEAEKIKLEEDIVSYSQSIENLKNTLDTSGSSEEYTHKQIEIIKDEQLRSARELEETNNKIKNLNNQLELITKEKLEVERQKKNLENENRHLLEEIDDHTKNIELIQDELDTVTKSKADIQKQIETIKTERIRLVGELKEANETIIELNNQLAQITTELGNEKDKTYELEMDIDRVNRAIDIKTKALEKKNEELNISKEENLEYRSKLSVAEEKNITLEIQLNNMQSNLTEDKYIVEIGKLNNEIENLKTILSEKNIVISDKEIKISSLEQQIDDNLEEHKKEIQTINESNELKIAEYRRSLTSNEIPKVSIETPALALDITRARVEGKKIISLVGSDILNLESYIEEDDNIFIAHDADDADIYILVTDLTKNSITEFKKQARVHSDSIKILVNWVDNLPFSPKSITGFNMDIIIRNTTDNFKDTWLNKNTDVTWKKDLNWKIKDRLGGF